MKEDLSTIRVCHPDGTDTLVPIGKVWRYLGIFFLFNLLWKEHVTRCRLKATAMARALCMFANCARGLSLANSRTVYLMAIRPLLTFGAPVWFTGTRQAGLVQQLQLGQNEGVRLAAGSFRTAHTGALHHLMSVPPIRYVLQKLCKNFSTRMRRIGRRHGITTRLSGARTGATLTKTWALSSNVTEVIEPAEALPGDSEVRIHTNLVEDITLDTIREFNKSAHALVVYTDGSLIKNGETRRSGAGVWITHQGQEVASLMWRCGPKAEVYDCEMVGLAWGMGAARRLASQLGNIKHILLAADNQSAIQNIRSTEPHPQQVESIAFRSSSRSFFQDRGLSVQVGWVQGHSGVAGNSKADKLAKAAAGPPSSSAGSTLVVEDALVGASISFARARSKEAVFSRWNADRTEDSEGSSARNAVGGWLATQRPGRELAGTFVANCRWGARAIQVRTGHGWFGGYYTCMNIPEEEWCPCSTREDFPLPPVPQTREHILLECPDYAEAHARHLVESLTDEVVSMRVLLGTLEGDVRLLGFLEDTNAFFKTCWPRAAQPPVADEDSGKG
jgi:ribonuclease HI